MTLEEVVAGVLRVPVAKLSDATGPQKLRAWDSIAHLEIVAAVENAFAVRFSVSEVLAITSLGALRALISQKKGSP